MERFLENIFNGFTPVEVDPIKDQKYIEAEEKVTRVWDSIMHNHITTDAGRKEMFKLEAAHNEDVAVCSSLSYHKGFQACMKLIFSCLKL